MKQDEIDKLLEQAFEMGTRNMYHRNFIEWKKQVLEKKE